MTVRTRAQLNTTIDSIATANGARTITGPLLNNMLSDHADSTVMLEDLGDLRFFASAGYTPGVTQADDILNTAIGAMNDGDYKGISFPPGETLLSDDFVTTNIIGPTSLARDYLSVVGQPGSLIRVEAGGGTASTIFQVGQGGDLGWAVSMRGLSIQYDNTPNTSDPTFNAFAYYDLAIQDIIVLNHAKLFKASVGGPVTLRNWKTYPGSNVGATDSVWHFADIAVTTLDDIFMSTLTAVGDTDADGKMFFFELPTSGSIDTLYMHNVRAQITNGLSNPRPYGLYFKAVDNASDGSIVNLWIVDNRFDATGIAGMHFDIAANNDSFLNSWVIRGNGFQTVSGKGMVISHAGDRPMAGVSITDNWAFIKDDSEAFDLNFGLIGGNGAISIDNNKAIDGTVGGTAGATKSAFKFTGDGWRAGPTNGVAGFFAVTPGWKQVIEVAGTTSGNFYAAPFGSSGIKRYSKEPAYTLSSKTRVLERPIDALLRSTRWLHRFEDFQYSSAGTEALPPDWLTFDGSDAQAVLAAVPDALGGLLNMITGDAAGDTDGSVNGVQLNYGTKNIVSSQGGSYFMARASLNIVTDISCFIGWSDRDDALEMPFTLSGSTYTSTASDACGFLLDTAGDNPDNWKLVGVKADVDATHLDSGTLGATGFHTFEIFIDDSENAYFWINGSPVGSTALASCITEGTLVTPYICLFSRTNASRILTLDGIRFGCARIPGW